VTRAKNKTKLKSLKKRSGFSVEKYPDKLNIYFEIPYIWQLLNRWTGGSSGGKWDSVLFPLSGQPSSADGRGRFGFSENRTDVQKL